MPLRPRVRTNRIPSGELKLSIRILPSIARSGPNKQNSERGIETLHIAHTGAATRGSPNKQNSERGIETVERNAPSVRNEDSPNKQNSERGIETPAIAVAVKVGRDVRTNRIPSGELKHHHRLCGLGPPRVRTNRIPSGELKPPTISDLA